MKILLLTFFAIFAQCQKMGPFEINIRSIENCGPKSGKSIVFSPRLRKFNRTVFVVNSPVYLPYDLDDTMECQVDLAFFTNGGWKENFYKQKFSKTCSTMKMFAKPLISSMLKTAGVKDECPIPKGNYTVKDCPMSLDIDAIPAFYYNRYKWRVTVYKGGQIAACLRSLVDVVPKRKQP